ncbi:hypothetical protein C8Q76DRAFT_6884 [Earliella scabrosa]|nr:hypothetical protein C8Q76DRAFT_6884 [Earliella scabrosa]
MTFHYLRVLCPLVPPSRRRSLPTVVPPGSPSGLRGYGASRGVTRGTSNTESCVDTAPCSHVNGSLQQCQARLGPVGHDLAICPWTRTRRIPGSGLRACRTADLGQRAHSPSRVLPPPFLMYTIQTANLFLSSLAQNDRRGPGVVHAPREMSQAISITALSTSRLRSAFRTLCGAWRRMRYHQSCSDCRMYTILTAQNTRLNQCEWEAARAGDVLSIYVGCRREPSSRMNLP